MLRGTVIGAVQERVDRESGQLLLVDGLADSGIATGTLPEPFTGLFVVAELLLSGGFARRGGRRA